MNGRIYDPRLGRFLQADPIVQAPKNGQNLNRYSYVLNNPLSYTDPSGYSLKSLWEKWLRPLAAIAITIWMPGSAAIFGNLAGSLFAATATGLTAGWVATGNLKGALVGAFTGAAFFGIGSHFQQFKGEGSFGGIGLSGGKFAAKTLAHGFVGGIQSSLNGGKFGHGFFAAGMTQAFSGRIGKIDPEVTGVSPKRVLAAATVGGSASALTGGKFANGAVTGAFSRALNDERHNLRNPKSRAEAIERLRKRAMEIELTDYDNVGSQISEGSFVAIDTLSGGLLTDGGIDPTLLDNPEVYFPGQVLGIGIGVAGVGIGSIVAVGTQAGRALVFGINVYSAPGKIVAGQSAAQLAAGQLGRVRVVEYIERASTTIPRINPWYIPK